MRTPLASPSASAASASQVERQGVHLDALAGIGRRPRVARAVAVELDAQRVEVVEVQRLGDEVVAGAA